MQTTIEQLTTREAYLAWRAEWKAEYKALSIEIRTLKVEIKNGARAGEYVGAKQWKLMTLQSKATNMLETLKKAKAVSAASKAKQQQEAA